jgi:soluble lytic murein transglycosylase-like protein
MRAILVSAILVLGLAGATPEPEYSAFRDYIRRGGNSAFDLVEIESATGRGDRLSLAALQPRVLRVEILRPDDRPSQLRLTPLDSDSDNPANAGTAANSVTSESTQPSLGDLCNTLLTSAQSNDLPVPFFANLLWQESQLRDDVVSKKGALGIAQFMPEVAAETGLANPFDPMQAIPASARFLQRLRLQFGNLGFVAAAYNAGAHRVIEWLERRASLPRETRDYVLRVTGLSVETWKTMPIENYALTFVPRLPCRGLPAFANVEQEQTQQAEQEHAKQVEWEADKALEAPAAAEPAAQSKTAMAHETKRARSQQDVHRIASETHGRKHEPSHATHEARAAAKHEPSHATHEARAAAKHEPSQTTREARAAKHEAAHSVRGTHERHKSA